MKFLLVGGAQRENAAWNDEWRLYKKALLVTADWLSGEVGRVMEYVSPPECIASEKSSILFKASTLAGNRLYLCTQTEVMIYEYPSLKLLHHISLPCFNDNHHVAVIGGRLAVVVTGLDMVVFLDDEFNPVEFCNVLGKDPWNKFSQETDYRKYETTKPHESHPNFIFEIDDEVWVTRFEQKDAVCLNDLSKRIDIGIEKVHDGRVVGDFVYFTAVNGMICVAHKYTHKIEEIYDINKAYKAKNPLGWCRGLHVDKTSIYVGFTSLRATALRENLSWIKHGFKRSKDEIRAMPTRLVEYDITKRSVVKEVNFLDVGMSAIFSVHRVD